jgi:putative FmdB family regulatory protein
MPIFEYQCKECKNVFEIYMKHFAQDEATVCPYCHAEDIERKLSTFSSQSDGKSANSASCTRTSKFFR